jgi:hypothetical protein
LTARIVDTDDGVFNTEFAESAEKKKHDFADIGVYGRERAARQRVVVF